MRTGDSNVRKALAEDSEHFAFMIPLKPGPDGQEAPDLDENSAWNHTHEEPIFIGGANYNKAGMYGLDYEVGIVLDYPSTHRNYMRKKRFWLTIATEDSTQWDWRDKAAWRCVETTLENLKVEQNSDAGQAWVKLLQEGTQMTAVIKSANFESKSKKANQEGFAFRQDLLELKLRDGTDSPGPAINADDDEDLPF